MVNSSERITSTWFNVATDVDYFLQNMGNTEIYVKASATIPTSISGSFRLEPNNFCSSTLLKGNIWVCSGSDIENLLVYAK